MLKPFGCTNNTLMRASVMFDRVALSVAAGRTGYLVMPKSVGGGFIRCGDLSQLAESCRDERLKLLDYSEAVEIICRLAAELCGDAEEDIYTDAPECRDKVDRVGQIVMALTHELDKLRGDVTSSTTRQDKGIRA